MAASLSIGIAIVMVLAFALSALATHRLARVGSRRWLLDHIVVAQVEVIEKRNLVQAPLSPFELV